MKRVNTVNVGIIGSAGHSILVVDAARKTKQFHLNALSLARDGSDESQLARLSREFGIPLFADWREMARNPDIDVIVVDSRNDLHAEMAIVCLKNGKHVYCEKPLALDINSLEQLENTWKTSGLALGGMFATRFSAWFLTIQQAIARDEIGAIRLIQMQKSYKLGERSSDYYGERKRYGGTIPWVSIHGIDLILALAGRCNWVSAIQSSAGNRGCGTLEMSAIVQLQMEKGVLASVTADYYNPSGAPRHDDDRIRVVGERGVIEMRDEVVWLENDLPRRMLKCGTDKNAFNAFISDIEREKIIDWGKNALESTRISLLAREAADRMRAINCSI